MEVLQQELLNFQGVKVAGDVSASADPTQKDVSIYSMCIMFIVYKSIVLKN